MTHPVPSVVAARMTATGVTCCGHCATTAHLLNAGDGPRDVANYLAWPEQDVAARLRDHGHHQLARRIAPPPRPTTTAPSGPVQGTLDL